MAQTSPQHPAARDQTGWQALAARLESPRQALTCSLGAALTAGTGLDTLEAVTGGARQALVEAPAYQAQRLIAAHLARAVAEPGDVHVRQQMQIAACLAGQAIDQGGTGLGHNIGHALGTLYHLPHGLAVALAVEATLDWSIDDHAPVFEHSARALTGGRYGADELPAAFSALAEAADFDRALTPFADLSMDACVLAKTMQAEGNAPMAANAARRPAGDDWQALAEATVERFEQRAARLRRDDSARQEAGA